jgi:hypothetical protein
MGAALVVGLVKVVVMMLLLVAGAQWSLHPVVRVGLQQIPQQGEKEQQ